MLPNHSAPRIPGGAAPARGLLALGVGLALSFGAGFSAVTDDADGPALVPAVTADATAAADDAFVPFFACFAPGTSESVMQSWYQRGAFKPGLLPEIDPEDPGAEYFIGGNWNGQGQPVELTWSFLPDGFVFPGGLAGSGSSSLFADMNAEFGGDQAQWISRFEASFNRWSLLTGINLTRVTFGGNEWDDGASWSASGNANRGDIRIGMRTVDGPSNTLAFAFFPGSGGGGNMIFDRDEDWDGALDDRLLRNTIFHEAGHTFGIEHVCVINGTKLMEPAIDFGYVGPRHDDLRAAHRLYGDPFEDNNSAGAAWDFGAVDTSGTFTPCEVPGAAIAVPPFGSLCSIDVNGEVDFYTIDVTEGNSLSVTVSPVGTTYSDNTQNIFGNCNSGNSTDSLVQADLALQVIAANGVTVLATSDSAGLGAPEVISDLDIGGPGTIYLRVYETGSAAQTQLYSLDISVEDVGGPAGEFNDIGPGVAGSIGTPVFTGMGDLTPGSATGFSTTVSNALPFNTGFLFLGLVQSSQPFKGGTLYPFPYLILSQVPMTGAGSRTLTSTIAPGTPSGLAIIAQWWFADMGAVAGASASNGLELVIP